MRTFTFSDRPIPDHPVDQFGVILRREGDNIVYTNVPHVAVHHSPTGFEFGYGGSGPADLALNICQWAATKLGLEPNRSRSNMVKVWGGQEIFAPVLEMYQDFKFQFIAPVDRDAGTVIEWEAVIRWVKTRVALYDALENDPDANDAALLDDLL